MGRFAMIRSETNWKVAGVERWCARNIFAALSPIVPGTFSWTGRFVTAIRFVAVQWATKPAN